MRKRHKVARKFSKKLFTRGAQRIHPKNDSSKKYVARGGIRL